MLALLRVPPPGGAVREVWWPYELFGQRASAPPAGNLWSGGMTVAAILGTARRLDGRLLALLFAAGTAVWPGANGLPLFLQPWNPHVGALPTIA